MGGFFLSDKVVKLVLVGGGSVINGAYPVYLTLQSVKFMQLIAVQFSAV